MLQSVAALKLKGNLFFLSVLLTHLTNTNFGCKFNLVPKKLDKRLSRTTFVSRTTFMPCKIFNLKEHISVNTSMTAIFNLNINYAYIYNCFSKTCYFKYLDV